MGIEETLNHIKQMDNWDRHLLLEQIYKEWFDTGVTPEQIKEEIKILEAYRNGELIENPDFIY